MTRELVSRLLEEEVLRLRCEVDPGFFDRYHEPARALIADLCLAPGFVDFLTLPAYEMAIADPTHPAPSTP